MKTNNLFKSLLLLLMVALFIGIAFIGSELYLKYQYQQTTIHSLFEKRLIWIKNLTPNANPTFTSAFNTLDSFHYNKQTFQATTDSSGFIITKRHHKQADYTFAFLGGSIPQSLYMNEQSRMPEAVATYVEEKTHLKINSLNCAAGGTNSLHTLNVLSNLVLERKPDFAFFVGNINDISTLMHYGKYNNANPKWGVFWDATTDVFPPQKKQYFPFLFDYIQSRTKQNSVKDDFADVRNSPLIFDSSVIMPPIKQVFKTIIAVCKANNIRPVLITQVNIFERLSFTWFQKNMALPGFTQKDYEQLVESFDLYNRILTHVAIEENVLLIQLSAEDFTFSDFYDPSHLNEKGTMLASQLIADQFIQRETFPVQKTVLNDSPYSYIYNSIAVKITDL